MPVIDPRDEIARLTAELAAERELHANAAKRAEYNHQEHLAANREIERLHAFVRAWDAAHAAGRWPETDASKVARANLHAAREAVGPCS